jgi:glycerophosphoryl diester phosphodiesterase
MARDFDPDQSVGVGGAPEDAVGHRRAFLTHHRPRLFAHRGGAALAPENTIAAFQNSLACGADVLELDVHLSRDGELVVIHDPTVDRTTGGTGLVATMTEAELHRLDAGYRYTPDGGQTFPFRARGITIPTLREVLSTFATTRLNVDLKENRPETPSALWTLVQEFEAEDRVLAHSRHLNVLARFRDFSQGRVATAASSAEVFTFMLAAISRTTRWLHPAYDVLEVPETWRAVRIVSPGTVAHAHRLGLPVHVWTIDEREAMDRLLTWGVDGIMTDRPDLLRDALAALRT